MSTRARLLASVLLAVPLACVPACGGGKTTVETKSTTVGKELQDLEDARNRGLVTESEYQKQREKIMKGK